MSDERLLGPLAWGGSCGTAMLKETAEDFQVDEVLDIPLSGTGEHLWLWMEKRELNTEEAARLLARAAGVPLRQVSYAGLKDRQALTRQWFSIQLPGRPDPDFSSVQGQTLQVLKAVRHGRKLQRGAHSANGFRLRLTHLQADPALLEQRLQQIAAAGVPNYFGSQRFGYGGGNLEQARGFIESATLPERRNLRSRLLSAVRSHLFNRVLAERVRQGTWNSARVGDLLAFSGSRSFFPAGAAEIDDPRLAALDLHPTGPLWGKGAVSTRGEIGELEERVVGTDPQAADWLAMAGLEHERRILRLPIGRLAWHYPAPDTLQLEFVLPAGCFATVVVRELVTLSPAG